MTADTDLVIVGGGPAGCAAAVMAASVGLSSTIIESRARLGGALWHIAATDNILGGHRTGRSLATAVLADVERAAPQVVRGEATSIEAGDDSVRVTLANGGSVTGQHVVVAAGVKPVQPQERVVDHRRHSPGTSASDRRGSDRRRRPDLARPRCRPAPRHLPACQPRPRRRAAGPPPAVRRLQDRGGRPRSTSHLDRRGRAGLQRRGHRATRRPARRPDIHQRRSRARRSRRTHPGRGRLLPRDGPTLPSGYCGRPALCPWSTGTDSDGIGRGSGAQRLLRDANVRRPVSVP